MCILRIFNYKKEYKCYDPINKKLHISRDVVFFEGESYFQQKENDGQIENFQQRENSQIEKLNIFEGQPYFFEQSITNKNC